MIAIYFADTAPEHVRTDKPGVAARLQDAIECTVEATDPETWTGDDIAEMFRTMAAIGGDAIIESEVSIHRDVDSLGLATLTMYLVSDPTGPRVWTQPLAIPPAVLTDWWEQTFRNSGHTY